MKYEMNNIYNEDCLKAMKQIPDNYFELAIVDPPYGIGVDGGIGNRDDQCASVVLEQYVARVGADDTDVIEAVVPQQVYEVHAVLFVLVADIAHIGVADAQTVDVVAVNPVLHAAVDGQVGEADVAGVDHVHRGIAAEVGSVGQVGAGRCQSVVQCR